MWREFVVVAFCASIAFCAPSTQCSQNASAAYVDINILIDTSSNMGTANLRKISTVLSLVLSKFPIGNQYDIAKNQRNTRIAIVTYADNATIIANYTQINNIQDVTKVLNALTMKNKNESNLYDALNKGMYIHTNCSDVEDDGCAEEYYYMRPSATIIFAASANSASLNRIPDLVNIMDFFDDGTIITVNFNPGNADLTKLLNIITFEPYANNSPMYNFIGSSNTLSNDLEWSILQANCYCGDDLGINTFSFNSTIGRWQRNAECMIIALYDNITLLNPPTPLGFCNLDIDLESAPGFILTQDRETWLENNLYNFPVVEVEVIGEEKQKNTANLANLPPTMYPFYFGLHKSDQGVWSYWNYAKNATTGFEFAAPYLNWAPGYPKDGDMCAVMDSNDGAHLVWKSYNCNTATTLLNMALCQSPACDATNIACCADCYYCQLNPDCGIFPEKRPQKRPKNDRILKKWAKKNGKYVRMD